MAVISSLFTVSAGQTSSGEIVISGGGLGVASGGAVVGTIVTQTGLVFILPGGTATGTTVQEGISGTHSGGQAVEGVANSTLVASGGIEAVGSGGVTSAPLVLTGGLEVIVGSGTAVGMTVNGGSAVVSSGGTASGTTVTNGGVMTVSSGGTDSHASVSSGGTVNVSSGGVDSGSTVGSGGTLNVSSGGVVNNVKTNDPNDQGVTAAINVLSGGTVSGGATLDGGMLTMNAGAIFEAGTKLIMKDTAELVLGQDTFKGTIKDFGGQDFIDLQKIRFTAATTETFTQTSGAGGTLTVAQGSHVANLHLTGTYTTANFALQSDGAHGTVVTFVPSAAHG